MKESGKKRKAATQSVLPEIEMYFSTEEEYGENLYYKETVQRVLRNVGQILQGGPVEGDFYSDFFRSKIPSFCYTPLKGTSGSISLYLLCRHQKDAFKFFFDMISKWMVPGRNLDVILFYAVDFHVPSIDREKYTMAEIKLNITSQEEYEEIKRNIQGIETEIKIGVESPYHARRILETKGLTADEKIGHVQNHVLQLTKRHPKTFEQDLFQEMQQMMILCSNSFKKERDSLYLAKMIAYGYFFRKNIREAYSQNPQKRHLFLKLLHRRSPKTGRRSLGVLVAVSFQSDKEVFEERHLMKAIQNYFPKAVLVEGSVFSARHAADHLGLLYLEVEGESGKPFDFEELQRLRSELPDELKNRVEHMMHPIFMPRNDEEIMRNVLSLGEQIKFTTDLPQVFVTFDEQTDSHLYFTIILVQVMKENDFKTEQRFAKADTFLEYFHDFTKVLGLIRKKYQKEATVFRVKINKEMFLRDDHSIDLNKARHIVVTELERVLGRFRDFNGGMISKQNELLTKVRSLLAEEGIYNDLLLENFFYSLTPATLRSVLDPLYLKTFFRVLVDTLDHGFTDREPCSIAIERDLNVVYVIVISENQALKKEIGNSIGKLNITRSELATVAVTSSGYFCLGYLLRTDDPYRQDHFCNTVQSVFQALSRSEQ